MASFSPSLPPPSLKNSSQISQADNLIRFVVAQNMNYTCVCVGGFLIVELVWWLVAGKAYSESMQKAKEEENAARHVVVVVSTDGNHDNDNSNSYSGEKHA